MFASANAQQAKPTPPTSPPAAVDDVDLEHAQSLIGRALFLRNFYAANELTFDAEGKVAGTPKTTDWTLSGMDVLKAERRAPGRIELEGVRVAIRYNQDQHIFERHPQKDDKLTVQVADSNQPKAFDAALAKIFSTGIDPALQRSMPDFWVHYFTPAAPWPQDELTGKPIYNTAAAPLPASATPASPEKKVEPRPTNESERDHVKGTMQVRMVVDEQGAPKHVAVFLPIGYGLDERTVEAVKQWRFKPAVKDQKPVPAGVILNQGFDFVPPPHP
ncbi:TonB family C-terminal domain-containing protein [Granulicella rosea]|uniref:TonB family C-terminal domain-containing protein n=2 Tax=Granulicella rosea TaxID=474952 RepID=A0A239L7G9_9BACT|nr:TonB family C-terminal domain-containing protein [Granulicella rosea]